MPSSGPETRSPAAKSNTAVPVEQRNALTQLGQISFINTLPVVVPLINGAVQTDCELVFGTPSELNKKLQARQLHLGAMSSFYFLEDGDFRLFPDISIAGDGKVGSVLLFSRIELKDLDGQIIDVPDSSATSIKLLQLLLKEEFGVEPILRKQLDSIDFRSDAKAVLFIGDKALKFDECNNDSMRVDLASWWKKQHSLPFVFGVWGARKNWAQSNQTHFEEIGASLVQACKLGLSTQLGAVIKEAAGRTGMTHDRLSDYYLNELDYRLTDQHIKALELFEQLCRKHGFLPPASTLC